MSIKVTHLELSHDDTKTPLVEIDILANNYTNQLFQGDTVKIQNKKYRLRDAISSFSGNTLLIDALSNMVIAKTKIDVVKKSVDFQNLVESLVHIYSYNLAQKKMVEDKLSINRINKLHQFFTAEGKPVDLCLVSGLTAYTDASGNVQVELNDATLNKINLVDTLQEQSEKIKIIMD